jgi:hypothetical protein
MPDPKCRARLLRAIQNDEKAAELARQIAMRHFEQDLEMQELFLPLIEEVKGMGRMVASELAWELFVLLELNPAP